jgi:hypothetical protein
MTPAKTAMKKNATTLSPDARRQIAEWRRALNADAVASLGPPAIPAATLKRLVTEAKRQRVSARIAGSTATVPQSNARGLLGRAAAAFLRSERTVGLLSAMSGFRVEPSFEASCYTYYDRAGHYCGLHRDAPGACEVTLLLCLVSTWRGTKPSRGVALEVYGRRYRTGQKPRFVMRSEANQLLVLRGSRVYHQRPRITKGERVIVLTACYRKEGT